MKDYIKPGKLGIQALLTECFGVISEKYFLIYYGKTVTRVILLLTLILSENKSIYFKLFCVL